MAFFQSLLSNNERAFTLLELLVVIAIIGLLASVAIFSFEQSKGKGADAAIKSAMNQADEQAELFYNSHNRSYEGVCANDPFDKNTIGRFLIGAQKTYGGTIHAPYSDGVEGTLDPVVEACHDSGSAYVAWVPLRHQSGSAWCIDSKNSSGIVTDVLPPNQTTCP